MAVFPARDLTGEVGKHFQGTAEERVLQAIRLGQLCLNLFLANQPPGMTPNEARAILHRKQAHRISSTLSYSSVVMARTCENPLRTSSEEWRHR